MTCRFNPRTHTGCDLRISRHRPSTVLSFQSTHPHGVRRYVIRRILRRAVVSIHAPTRGATAIRTASRSIPPVSIHAPTRGATIPTALHSASYSVFQSTHPHGVRPTRILGVEFVTIVSIHAPTRGATRPKSATRTRISRFNPRTHTGCDCRPWWRVQPIDGCFNPRTHTGCDVLFAVE